MRFSPCSINDATGEFDIELEGFGRIAHVDPFRADDPSAFRALLCAAPDMLAALTFICGLMGNVDHSSGGGENAARLYGGMLMSIKEVAEKAIAKAGGAS